VPWLPSNGLLASSTAFNLFILTISIKSGILFCKVAENSAILGPAKRRHSDAQGGSTPRRPATSWKRYPAELEAGADGKTGGESVETTQIYLDADLALKERL
jgi:hypothetical protein